MNVPPVDLRRQYQKLGPELDAAVGAVLASGHYILGPEVAALEREVADYCGVAHGVGVASGTDALVLALRALGVGLGTEVITTPFSFVATAAAISRVGAWPVFADIDPATFCLDPAAVEVAITDHTVAILPVHLYGHPADMTALCGLADAHDLVIVQDAAQAIGATWHGQSVAAYGDATALSFYPTKNLGAAGDGGMVLTNDARVAERVDVLRRQGSPQKYRAEVLGYNSRLDEVQAAILRVKLEYLEAWQHRRRWIARIYAAGLDGRGLPLTLPRARLFAGHAWHQYTVRVQERAERDLLLAHLHEAGIGATVYYPVPIHLQAPFRRWCGGKYQEGDMPEAERAAVEVISLPIYPEMTEPQVVAVCQAIVRFYE